MTKRVDTPTKKDEMDWKGLATRYGSGYGSAEEEAELVVSKQRGSNNQELQRKRKTNIEMWSE